MEQRVFRRTLPYLGKYPLTFAVCVIAAVISVVAFLLLPVIVGRVIDQIIGPGQVQFDEVMRLLRLFLLALGVAVVFQWMLLAGARSLSAKVAQDVRQEAFDRIHNSPISAIDAHPHGDLVNRLIADAEVVSEGLLVAISGLLPGAVTMVATMVFMLTLDVPIALLVMVVTPLSILPARTIARRTKTYFRAQSEIQGELGAFVSEMVQNRAQVAAMNYEDASQHIFDRTNETFFAANVRAIFYSSLAKPITRFVNALIYTAIGVLGAISAVSGGLTVGSLSALLAYAHQYTRPFNEGAAHLTQIQATRASLERIYEIADWAEEALSPADTVQPSSSEGNISLNRVSFSYDKDRPVLHEVGIDAPSGSHIAIVGQTGSGKTTLMNLLLRFFDTDGGEITIDGIPITQIDRQALRRLFGMVLQDSWIRSGTVRENIAYGKPEASMEEVIEAAKQASIHNFILKLPQGYDTPITDDDSLSAGQKQLLSIARIFLVKPPMLLLDEATSSIDTRTEMLVQQALRRLMEGRTSFIVAHRLGTIRNADAIVVLDQGRVVEYGTHESLLNQGGFYAKLYKSQFGGNSCENPS